MANLNKEFFKFHTNIKVEEESLRSSRDALVEKIKAKLSEEGRPLPQVINQGSYIYGVGIAPIAELEHDIDVGLEFEVASEGTNAIELRKWVFEAIDGHTKKKPELTRALYKSLLPGRLSCRFGSLREI